MAERVNRMSSALSFSTSLPRGERNLKMLAESPAREGFLDSAERGWSSMRAEASKESFQGLKLKIMKPHRSQFGPCHDLDLNQNMVLDEEARHRSGELQADLSCHGRFRNDPHRNEKVTH